MMDTTKYPIGTQSFANLRHDQCVYVDKTPYIYKLVHSGARTHFLSRPRRFGKSLFLSTLEAYFRGRKELFEGLYIYDKETEWKSYPVLHFDFSGAEVTRSDRLERYIMAHLHEFAKEYGVTLPDTASGVGPTFGFLIREIAEKTQSQVVILIDEYDKGIVEVLDKREQLERNQEILRPFFSQIKQYESHLQFCFITGIARFRHYTLFSGLNNPDDISLDERYAAICGITEKELLDNFNEGIQALGESIGISTAQAVDMLRLKYDGYRFTSAKVLVYNPFSILNCLDKQSMSNYWLKSGSPKVFLTYLTKSKFNIYELTLQWFSQSELESIFSADNPIPLLFQTGYLTICDYDDGYYRLDIPNGEVRMSLVDELIPHYMGIEPHYMPTLMVNLRRLVLKGDIDGFMTILQSLVAKTPFHQFDYQNIEKTYHLIVYQLFLLMGIDTRSEICVSGGRIDMVATTPNYTYVFEFKLDGTPEQALEQIDSKGYALSWDGQGRKVYKIGVVFSSQSNTISGWAWV